MTILLTPRLRLVPFEDDHLAGLNAMNSDIEVMRFLGGEPESLADTQKGIDRVKSRWQQYGYSWWSFLDRSSGELVGAGCLQPTFPPRSSLPEIGWRLRRDRWGQGLASEAARRIARFAFDQLSMPVIEAVCAKDNLASAQVMQRLGMRLRGMERLDGEEGVFYEMTAQEWARSPARAKAMEEVVPQDPQDPHTPYKPPTK